MAFWTKDKFLFGLYTFFVLVVVGFALFAPWLAPYDPYDAVMRQSLQAPSAEHIFGTDKLGRDCFSRILYGMRTSLIMTMMVVSIITVGGTFIGVVAGYSGGKVDTVLMRIVDMMLAFPGIVLAIAIAGMLGGNIVNAILALAAVNWTKYARLGRSLTLKLRERDFIAAAVTNGTRPLHLLWRHILPNILPIIVITAAMDIGVMIMELAGLSFLGFGAQPPTPEWGLMLNEGRQHIQTAPWLMLYPGAAILIVVAIFNLWGDSLRDIMDPQRTN
ncbi:nickel transporter permease [Sporomusa termitida]|uniref:Glutathione transport system permease protein GsiD n=1 Tax=Sporomusa termitida TaxID=2377 RepID=A0A517DYZ5_9FIRM|nr:nickel transporter permease [Sporomusa termitida]QDR82571.1 Glutathione transport system permease protein GsiD [Sporomusa termitida]